MRCKEIESIYFVTRWIEHIVPFVCQTVCLRLYRSDYWGCWLMCRTRFTIKRPCLRCHIKREMLIGSHISRAVHRLNTCICANTFDTCIRCTTTETQQCSEAFLFCFVEMSAPSSVCGATAFCPHKRKKVKASILLCFTIWCIFSFIHFVSML